MVVAPSVLRTTVMTKTKLLLTFSFLAASASTALAGPLATTSFDPRFCSVALGGAGSDLASWIGLAALGTIGAVAMRRKRR